MKAVVPANQQDPLQCFVCTKVFIYNNEKTGTTQPYTNIWQFADPKYKTTLNFKNPFQEGVNANFLTMITSPEWSAKIAKAYKDYYGKDITLTTQNAGFEWIKAIYKNDLINGTSDTTIAENIGVKGQNTVNPPVGLFVYSKARYATTKNLALKPALNMSTEESPMPIALALKANASVWPISNRMVHTPVSMNRDSPCSVFKPGSLPVFSTSTRILIAFPL